MKYLRWGAITLITLIVIIFGVQYLASERVEVVELHTQDESGETVTTRLWIVDDEGYQYLRVGVDSSGWFQRVESNESFQLTRAGDTRAYTAVLRHDKSDRINALMSDKYTWGDSIIGVLIGSRDNSVAIELHPL